MNILSNEGFGSTGSIRSLPAPDTGLPAEPCRCKQHGPGRESKQENGGEPGNPLPCAL